MKNYSAAIKEAIANGNPTTELITLNLTGIVLRLTTAGHDIEYDGIPFLSNSQVLAISGIKQQQQLRVNQLNISLTAVDQSLLALFLNESQNNRKVNIQRVILTDTHQVIGTLINVNYIINDTSVEDSEDESTIDVSLSNSLSNFESVTGIRTTLNSFRRFFPNSTFFINSKDTKKELKWGGK